MKVQNNVTVQDQDGNSSKPLLAPVYLTVAQLKKACENHSYILARFSSGNLMGINTKVANIALKRKYYDESLCTNYIGYIPCDFQTYISHKHSFC
jgi:hypothetical protein